MPLWVLILLFSLCLTTITGLYTLRQNGRNGHRNGNGNGHSISQMTKAPDQPSSEGPPLARRKQIVIGVPQRVLHEEETASPEESKHRKEPQPHLPDEEPHDHPDSHDDPPSAIREPRRFRVRPREEEQEDEEDGLTPEKISEPVAKEIVSAICHIEDSFVSVLNIIEKQGQEIEELQESVTKLMTDQGVQAQPDVVDEEVQISVARENQTTQAIPSMHDMGTGEWLAHQQSIGIGDPVEAQDQGIQVNVQQRDQSLQENPEYHSIGIGSELIAQDQEIQAYPVVRDEEIQQDVSRQSVSIQGDAPSLMDQSIEAIPDRHDISAQISVSRHDVSIGEHLHVADEGIQNSVHNQSIGLGSPHASMRDESLQAIQETQDIALQGSIAYQSVGVGTHRSYVSQEMQAKPDDMNQSLQIAISQYSIGLRPRSFSVVSQDVQSQHEKLESLDEKLHLGQKQIFGMRKGNQYVFFDPKDRLDYLPLEKSILLEDEEEKLQSFRMKSFHSDDMPLQESIHLIQPKSSRLNLWDNESVESIYLQGQRPPRNLWDHDSVESIHIPTPRKSQEEDAWSLRSSQVSAHSVHTMRSLRSDELEDLMKQ